MKQIHHKKFFCYHLKHMTYVLYLEKQSMPMSEKPIILRHIKHFPKRSEKDDEKKK